MDFLLKAYQFPKNRYYMAAGPFEPANISTTDNTTATAIIESYSSRSIFLLLPDYNDTNASTNFTFAIRGLLDRDHPIEVQSTNYPLLGTIDISMDKQNMDYWH